MASRAKLSTAYQITVRYKGTVYRRTVGEITSCDKFVETMKKKGAKVEVVVTNTKHRGEIAKAERFKVLGGRQICHTK